MIFEFGGAPVSLARKIAAAKKEAEESEGGAGRKRGVGKMNSRPARAKIIKSQRPDFRQKKFGF
ncbi:hypothetical protein COY61_00510 [bacterium (Candidatus Gribaldobacteria) CG_4_10_14_0_8_um_filter_33_9]|uniref:Uncharacterized protein n=1 Tax=bacterium (Candidatus Gribaldobacteria) CG_4_10_14_0_8_um_filter_33_9 TaxID=2014266 RepID=A0A2M7RPA0_9BACT|nr:MAG: hypothetical protein COY61_00510 [bacterium (Candidatus Gribaldobacteria) CG_4_10_14_0_8_um_filter_33_9]